MEKEIKEKKEICKAPGCVRFGKEKHYICDPENYCRNCNKKKEYCVCDKMPKEIKEKIENILLEAWRGIGDYKTDGREFPRSDKLSDFADQILELFFQEKTKMAEEIEKWLKEADITKPASSVVAILYRKLKNLP